MPFDQALESTTLPHIWNVSRAVGKNSPNDRLDVLLVQYLLMKVYEDVQHDGRIRPKGNLTLDGVCGPITKNWILKFQLDINQDVPGLVSTDGRIDRAHGLATSQPGPFSPDPEHIPGRMIYTIVALNRVMHDDFPELHDDPMSATDMPMELKLVLVSTRFPVAA